MTAAQWEETVTWGERALELAERLDELEIVVHALTTIGTLSWRRAGRRSSSAASRSRGGRGSRSTRGARTSNSSARRVESATTPSRPGICDAGIAYCSDRDLDSCRLYLIA